MATTFHITNFKNKTVNMLTGVNTPTPASIAFLNVNNGVQPADPSIAVPGSSVYSSTAASIPLTSGLTAAAAGISSLNGTKSANASSSVSALTWGRLFDTAQSAVIDCSVGLAAGGAIISSLSSTIGNPLNLTQMSLKLPTSNGTLILSQALNNRLVDVWTGNSAVIPSIGTSAIIDLYTGSIPATADIAATGTLVATFTGNATNWFAAAANGSAILASNPAATANGTGTPTYFRWYKTVSSILFTIQGTVGLTATDLVVNTTTLVSGVTAVSITELTISL